MAGLAGALRQLEQRVETLLALEPERGVRTVIRETSGAKRLGASRANVRFHCGSRPCFGGGRKRGQHNQGLGRSRGGFSCKIHLKTDKDGLVIAFDITGGEKGDAPHFAVLADLGPDITPRAMIGDKGYDSKANRELARNRGAVAVIPQKSNAKVKQVHFPKLLYKARARIEQAVGKLKRFKRIALRCEKTAKNFLAFIALACGFIWIKSVHTA